MSSSATKATAGGFALVLEPTPHTQLQMLKSETKMALNCKKLCSELGGSRIDTCQ